MIDSVVLQLEEGLFEVINKNHFDGRDDKQIKGQFNVSSNFTKGIKGKFKKEGKYFPDIRIPERKIKIEGGKTKIIQSLEIQISLPKALYGGSNIFEIDKDNLSELYNKIIDYSKIIGVEIEGKDLKQAILKRVDFSKIINLPPYFGTAGQVIKKLANFDYKHCSDFDYKEYNTNGHGSCLKFWNKTQGYAIYDKLSEIEAHGYTLFEKDLIKAIEENKLKKCLLKFELSLQRKQSLEAVLRKYIKNKKKDFTLDDIFQIENIAKSILLEAFDKVYSPLNVGLITLEEMKGNELEQLLAIKKIPFKNKFFLSYLVNNSAKIGIASLFEELKDELPKRTFARYKKDALDIIQELGELSGNTPNLIKFLRDEHLKFELIKSNSRK